MIYEWGQMPHVQMGPLNAKTTIISGFINTILNACATIELFNITLVNVCICRKINMALDLNIVTTIFPVKVLLVLYFESLNRNDTLSLIDEFHQFN